MAWLSTGEVNSRQIVAIINDLDRNYEDEGRIATWSCYRIIDLGGGVESYDLVEQAETVIEPKAYTASYIFGNLTPATSYRITVVISGIIGSSDKFFGIQQSTATSGGIDYGQIPHIRFFTAENSGIGVPQIKCYLKVTNLLPSENYISIAAYSKKDGLLATSWTTNVEANSFDGYITLPDNDYDSLSYDTYDVRLLVQNNGVKEQEANATVTLTEAVISLYCFFEDKQVVLGNGNVHAVVYNYPNISAESWNAFWNVVNRVRAKAGLDEITDDYVFAVEGTEMTGILFGYLYAAIDEIYSKIDNAFKPEEFAGINISQYFKITPKLIWGIESGLQTAFNYLYT